MYMVDSNPHKADAKSIRQSLRSRYFEPARRRRETLVTLRAGDIHRELGLRNRVPNVCQVMESRILEKEAGVKVSSKQGPPSGRGTSLTVTYVVEPAHDEAKNDSREIKPVPLDHPGVALFYELRGLAADIYAAEGGGEAWLKKERENFYGPNKKRLEDLE